MAATSLQRSKTALGASFRRIARHKEGAGHRPATRVAHPNRIRDSTYFDVKFLYSLVTCPAVNIGGHLASGNGAGVLCDVAGMCFSGVSFLSYSD
jgi:hypothetical protein